MTITNDSSWREIQLPFKRGRTLKTAVKDAIAAYPTQPKGRIENGHEIYGDIVKAE